jgi:hypothetical protein
VANLPETETVTPILTASGTSPQETGGEVHTAAINTLAINTNKLLFVMAFTSSSKRSVTKITPLVLPICKKSHPARVWMAFT